MGTIWWIAVGLGAGWVTSRLMLYGDRRVPGAVVGMMGAFLGGTALRLLAPGAQGEGVTSLVAALAGAIGLTFAVSVFTSERRTEPVAQPVAQVVPRAHPEESAATLSYEGARDALIEQLLADAAAHDAERFDQVGRRFDAVERQFPRGPAPELARLRVALTFWDGWIDARNLGWQSADGIRKAEWPVLARGIASDLAGDQDVSNSTLRGRFEATAGRSLAGRAQMRAARLAER